MDLVSLKRSAADKKDESASIAPANPTPPDYPYGLVLDLDDDTLEKLGIGLLRVGATVMITARATVRSTRQYESDTQQDTDRSMTLQITDAAIAVDAGSKRAEDSLYPGDSD